jgi:hypothetical protein
VYGKASVVDFDGHSNLNFLFQNTFPWYEKGTGQQNQTQNQPCNQTTRETFAYWI